MPNHGSYHHEGCGTVNNQGNLEVVMPGGHETGGSGEISRVIAFTWSTQTWRQLPAVRYNLDLRKTYKIVVRTMDLSVSFEIFFFESFIIFKFPWGRMRGSGTVNFANTVILNGGHYFDNTGYHGRAIVMVRNESCTKS